MSLIFGKPLTLPAPEGGGWHTQFCLSWSHPAEAPWLQLFVLIFMHAYISLNKTKDWKILSRVNGMLKNVLQGWWRRCLITNINTQASHITHVYVCINICTCIYSHTHAYMYMYIFIYAYTYIYACICMYICIYVCVLQQRSLVPEVLRTRKLIKVQISVWV